MYAFVKLNKYIIYNIIFFSIFLKKNNKKINYSLGENLVNSSERSAQLKGDAGAYVQSWTS